MYRKHHHKHPRPRPQNQFPFTEKTSGPELTMMSTADDAAKTVSIMDAYVKASLANMTSADAYACLGGNTSAFRIWICQSLDVSVLSLILYLLVFDLRIRSSYIAY